MEEQIGIAHRVTVSWLSPTTKPSLSQPTRPATPPASPAEPREGYVKLGKDEVVINKAVLQSIKWGTELALKGQAPASFSVGMATAGDIPFKVPQPAKHQVHCDLCRKDCLLPRCSGDICIYTGVKLTIFAKSAASIWPPAIPMICTWNLVAAQSMTTTA